MPDSQTASPPRRASAAARSGIVVAGAGGLNGNEVRLGATGHVLVAPVGTAAPTDVTTPWGSGWYDLGYLNEDGPTLTPSIDSNDIMSWQSATPVRKSISRTYEIGVTLIQTNAEIVRLAFGGGEITETNGVFHYVPPPASEIDERAFGIEVQDGQVIDRWIWPRCQVTDVGDIQFQRTEATPWPLTVSPLTPASGVPIFERYTNDPAFALAATG